LNAANVSVPLQSAQLLDFGEYLFHFFCFLDIAEYFCPVIIAFDFKSCYFGDVFIFTVLGTVSCNLGNFYLGVAKSLLALLDGCGN
jgi:hypothetical protein